MSIEIKAENFSLEPRSNGSWWLPVDWVVINKTDNDCYILSKGPISIELDNPIIFDHTLSVAGMSFDPNLNKPMLVNKVEPYKPFFFSYTYALPEFVTSKTEGISFLGKFLTADNEPEKIWLSDYTLESIRDWGIINISQACKI